MKKILLFAVLAAAVVPSAFSSGLGVEPQYGFRKRLEQVHKRDLRDAALCPAADEFAFRDGCIVPSEDFADYLSVSMGVKAHCDAKAGNAAVKIAIDGKIPERQYEIEVGKDGVSVRAHDRRASLQALFHLEDVMSLRRAPFLKHGKTVRRGKFSCRMTHAGWGKDEFPDAHLASIAHAGFDAILFYVRGVDKTAAGKTDINDLIERAEKWGLDAYLYSSLSAEKHPDDPESDADMARSYGAVARTHRKAKGFVIVPESCYFESKDPRVMSKTRKTDEKGRPLANPSRFPCVDYPQWLAKVEKTIRAEIPGADVVFWTYNFFWTPEKDRFAFIDAVTPTTTLNVSFALGNSREHPTRLGVYFPMSDYSICEPGPSALFRAEGQRAHSRGLKLYTTCNTGGRTWDFGGCPYEPVPQQWKRRFDALCKAQDDVALSGMIESHHYGFVPNFIAELAKEAFTEGGMPFDEHLRLIAARDFGELNAVETVAVWADLSDAIRDYVATSQNQYGPFRVGPAYPFNALGKFFNRGDPDGWIGFNSWICNPNYGWNIPWRGGKQTRDKLDETKHRVEIELFNSAGRRFVAGGAKLGAFARSLKGERRARALRQAGVVEYIGRCFLTSANVKAAALAELAVLDANSTQAEKQAAKEEIYRLAKAEYANTAAALPLVEADSMLGFECANRYMGGRERIVWKLRHMEKLYGLKPCGGEAKKAGGAKRDVVVYVSCHPDDLAGSVGTILRLKEKYDVHVIDFTRGERGLGEAGYRDGSTARLRTAEEEAVCREIGVTLHWCSAVDGEAFADRASCEQIAAIFRTLKPRAIITHWLLETHKDHLMSAAAAIKATQLAGIAPEIYFQEQEIQSRAFPATYYVDVSDSVEIKRKVISLYKCQNGPSIAERKLATARTNALRIWGSCGRSAEVFGVFPGTIGRNGGIFDSLERVSR